MPRTPTHRRRVRTDHANHTSRSSRLDLHGRLRGHRLGGHRPQRREHERAWPPGDRGAWRDRQSGRGRAGGRDQRPRTDERQGLKLHCRRRHPRIPRLRHRGQDQGRGHADSGAARPHRQATCAGGRRHPRLLPRRRTRIGTCLRLAHRRPRGGDTARLPRGEARHLPWPQRHRARHPSRRSRRRHDCHADREDAAPHGGKSDGLRRSARADPSQSPLGGAQSRAAKAPVEGRAVVEEADAETAGPRHARQADARQDGSEGTRGALPASSISSSATATTRRA